MLHSSVSLGKFGSFRADDIIGKPFGLSYEVVGRKELRVISQFECDDAGTACYASTGRIDANCFRAVEYDSDANNREIAQDNKSQQLTQTQIEEMKRNGLDGQLDAEVTDREWIIYAA